MLANGPFFIILNTSMCCLQVIVSGIRIYPTGTAKADGFHCQRLSSSALSLLPLLFRAIKGGLKKCSFNMGKQASRSWRRGGRPCDHSVISQKHAKKKRKFRGNVWVAINMMLSQRWNGKGSWQPLNHRSNVRWKRTGQLWTNSEKKVLLILNTPSPTGFTLAFPPNGIQMLHGPVSRYLGENSSAPPLS